MARSIEGRRKRATQLKARIASTATDHFAACTIWGCGMPTLRAARLGLAAALCQRHLAHRQRHGSPFCPSPTAPALRPYVMSALSFLELCPSDAFVAAALHGLSGALASA